MKKITWIIALCIFMSSVFFMGCPNSVITPIPPPTSLPTPGKFSVVQVSQAQAKALVPLGTITVDSSQSIFFILKNVGTYSIKNIEMNIEEVTKEGTTVTGSSSDFIVTPNEITVLNSDATSSIVNLIQVSINHGLISGKVGQSNYINPEVANAIVNISGVTTVDGGTYETPVSLQAQLSTLIDIAAWDIQYSFDQISWTSNGQAVNGSYSTPNPPEDFITFDGTHYPFWRMIRIVNTGNVPITLMASYSGEFFTPQTTIPVGESYTFETTTLSSVYPWYVAAVSIIVNTNGTVFDNTLSSNMRNLQFNTGTSLVPFTVN